MPKTKFISEETENEVVTETVEDAPKAKRKFDQADGIPCRSIISGGLYMRGLKTEMVYSWTDYDDISEVEYRDLVAAVRSKSKFVYNPWFIIEDEDFLAEFPQLKKFYDDSHTTRELIGLLSLPVDQMVAEIEKLPAGAKESMKGIAAKQVFSGMLDSVSKIKALDKVFGTELNLVGSLLEDEAK